MEHSAVDQKYIKLCSRYHIVLSILHTGSAQEPKHSMKTTQDAVQLTVNTARIRPEQYESQLAYLVSGILLPRLVLQTERLLLRRFQPDDAEDCFAFLSHQPSAHMDCSRAFSSMDGEYQELMALFMERQTQYAVVLKETGRVIGTVHIFPDDTRAVWAMEIGYSISPAHRRKGYATEALSALLELLQKDLLLDMLVAGILPDNHISARLLEKLSFQKEGLRHNAIWHEGLDHPVDLIYYYRDRP